MDTFSRANNRKAILSLFFIISLSLKGIIGNAQSFEKFHFEKSSFWDNYVQDDYLFFLSTIVFEYDSSFIGTQLMVVNSYGDLVWHGNSKSLCIYVDFKYHESQGVYSYCKQWPSPDPSLPDPCTFYILNKNLELIDSIGVFGNTNKFNDPHELLITDTQYIQFIVYDTVVDLSNVPSLFNGVMMSASTTVHAYSVRFINRFSHKIDKQINLLDKLPASAGIKNFRYDTTFLNYFHGNSMDLRPASNPHPIWGAKDILMVNGRHFGTVEIDLANDSVLGVFGVGEYQNIVASPLIYAMSDTFHTAHDVRYSNSHYITAHVGGSLPGNPIPDKSFVKEYEILPSGMLQKTWEFPIKYALAAGSFRWMDEDRNIGIVGHGTGANGTSSPAMSIVSRTAGTLANLYFENPAIKTYRSLAVKSSLIDLTQPSIICNIVDSSGWLLQPRDTSIHEVIWNTGTTFNSLFVPFGDTSEYYFKTPYGFLPNAEGYLISEKWNSNKTTECEYINTAISNTEHSVDIFVQNPIDENIEMRISVDKDVVAEILLFNNLGKMVLNERKSLAVGSNYYTHKTEGLPKGIYHIVLSVEDQLYSRKLVLY